MEQQARQLERLVDLFEKSLAIQLYSTGMGQTAIAKRLGKGNDWVNSLLKGVPRRGRKR